MAQARMAWRWLLAVVFHAVVLIVLIRIGESFLAGGPDMPRGVRVAEWAKQVQLFLISGFGIALGVFVAWNVLFAIPAIKINAQNHVRLMFPIAAAVGIVAEIADIALFLSGTRMGEWTSMFSGSMMFYLSPLLYAVPLVASMLLLSPFVIMHSRNWYGR
jgi:hypothetical protein